MRIIKEDKSNDDDNLLPFGVNFKQELVDDDIIIWAQGQLKDELIRNGIILISELGQDVQGNKLSSILTGILFKLSIFSFKRQ